MRRPSPEAAEQVYRYCVHSLESLPNVPHALESEWALASRFKVSRRKARHALQRLVREGRAVCYAGKGYYSRPQQHFIDVQNPKIGIVHESPHRPYSTVRSALLTELCRTLESHKFTSRVLPIEMPETGTLTQRVLANYDVDAYLLFSVSPATQAFFAGQSKPTVVLGNTTRDLGLASVAIDELELTRQITEQLLASGHRSVVLVQEKTQNLGVERSRVGFLYAHHAQRVRYYPDLIVRVDREKTGMWKALRRLFQMSPSALLVQTASLLEMIWSRATGKNRAWLETSEVIVLTKDITRVLCHPARVVEFELQWECEAAVRLLEDCIRGRKNTVQYQHIPWKLVGPISVQRAGEAAEDR